MLRYNSYQFFCLSKDFRIVSLMLYVTFQSNRFVWNEIANSSVRILFIQLGLSEMKCFSTTLHFQHWKIMKLLQIFLDFVLLSIRIHRIT